MNDQNPPLNHENNGPLIDFHHRAASTTWEPIRVVGSEQSPEQASSIVWAWFKPQGIQNQLTISIPPETFQAADQEQPLTLLQLLQSVQIHVEQLATLSLFGSPIEIACQDHPVLHQAIQPPETGTDPCIHIIITTGPEPEATICESPSSEVGAVSGGMIDEGIKKRFRAIETDWSSVQQIESQLKVLRKQLDGLLGRLNSLNRDLSPEENLHADRMDIRDWQDARRWLRDMASRVSRYLKEHDIGTTSNAGIRIRLTQIYQQFVVPETPFEGIEQIQHEFEAYRKLIQNLMQAMSATHGTAKTDGEQRALQVLRRIAAKTRAARVRK